MFQSERFPRSPTQQDVFAACEAFKVAPTFRCDWLDWMRHGSEIISLERGLRFGEPWLATMLSQETEKKLGGIVARSSAGVLGYIVYEISPTQLTVRRIAVSADHQRQGVGTSLINHLKEERLLQNECREIRALVSEHDLASQSFLSSQEFVISLAIKGAGLYSEDLYGFSFER